MIVKKIFFFLLFLYVIVFICYLINMILHRVQISFLHKDIEKIISILDQELLTNSFVKASTSGCIHINETKFNNDMSKVYDFNQQFSRWDNKASHYMYHTSIYDLNDKINRFLSFEQNYLAYLDDYGIQYVFKKTLQTPSIILSYIGIPNTLFSRLVNIVSGIMVLYGAYEKLIQPFLKSKGLL